MSETNIKIDFPFLTIMGCLFVGLKLTGYIDWSWLWVTLPFWIGFVLVAVLVLFGLMYEITRKLIEKI